MFFSFLADFTKTYNYFIQMDENIRRDLDNVYVLYDKRVDILSKVNISSKQYEQHEKDVIKSITEARAKILNSKEPEEKIKAIRLFDEMVTNVMVNIENYPNLKADKLFIKFIDILTGTENEIIQVKQQFNKDVLAFNKSYNMFPYVIVARFTGKETWDYFKESGK